MPQSRRLGIPPPLRPVGASVPLLPLGTGALTQFSIAESAAIVNPGSLLTPASVPAPARQAGSSQSVACTAGKVCFGSNVTAVICASAFSSASQWSWSSRIRSVGSFHVLHDGTGVARNDRCPLFRAFPPR